MADDDVTITRHGVPIATIKVAVREGAPEATGKRVCSFCGKTEDEIQHLILGITKFVDKSYTERQVGICDECVDLAAEIVAEERPATGRRFEGLICGLCRSRVPLGGFVNVPDRGLLCLACLEAVQSIRQS